MHYINNHTNNSIISNKLRTLFCSFFFAFSLFLFSCNDSSSFHEDNWDTGEKDTVNILAVGNSWTINATTYLGNILEELGYKVKIYVSYAGGATLESYWNNIINAKKAYEVHTWKNGEWHRPKTLYTYEEIIMSEKWDIITHQQQSGMSGVYETYQPYLHSIITWEQKKLDYNPSVFLLSTWSYPNGTKKEQFASYYNNDTRVMYNSILKAYNQALKDEKISIVIPCTPIIQQAREIGIKDIDTSDGTHLSTNGCYAASIICAETLLQFYFHSPNNALQVKTKPIELSDEDFSILKKLVVDILENMELYFPSIRH